MPQRNLRIGFVNNNKLIMYRVIIFVECKTSAQKSL